MQLGFICDRTPADLQLAADIGYANVEVFISVRGEGPVEFPDKTDFISALHDSPTAVSAVALHNDEFPISDDAALKQLSEDRYSAALEIACELDAHVLYTACELDAHVLYTGSGLHPTADDDEIGERTVSVFGPRLERTVAAGRQLAFISCKTANRIRGSSMWARVLPQLDGAGIKYDPSHSAYDGRDYLAETEEWGRYFQHFHAKDFMKIGNRMVADPNPGFGQTEWGPLFALLYEAEYSGSVGVDPRPDHDRRAALGAVGGTEAGGRFASQLPLPLAVST